MTDTREQIIEQMARAVKPEQAEESAAKKRAAPCSTRSTPSGGE